MEQSIMTIDSEHVADQVHAQIIHLMMAQDDGRPAPRASQPSTAFYGVAQCPENPWQPLTLNWHGLPAQDPHIEQNGSVLHWQLPHGPGTDDYGALCQLLDEASPPTWLKLGDNERLTVQLPALDGAEEATLFLSPHRIEIHHARLSSYRYNWLPDEPARCSMEMTLLRVPASPEALS